MSTLLRIVRVKMDGIWEPLAHYISPYMSPYERERPLGRWERQGNVDLKVDYANMDSGGDILCRKLDYGKKKGLGK